MKYLFSVLIFTALLCGCENTKNLKTAEGLLRHYPSNVKSVEAWHGHEFKVGDVPIIPTQHVSREKVLQFVGKRVLVKGVWFEGREWNSNDDDFVESSPHNSSNNKKIIRGNGIRIQSISLK